MIDLGLTASEGRLVMPKHRDERKAAGVEVQNKLRQLKGRSRSDLIPDAKRGPTSGLGMGSHSKAVKRGKGR